MANDAKFNFYLNRQGPRGQKGEKGDQGFSPSITVNTNTADEYTLLIQNEYDSFVTDNIRPTYDDRGGTYVRVDRDNNVQYFGTADIATTANYGEVKLATEDDVATGSTTDNDSNVVTAGILKGVKVNILTDTVTLTTDQTITGFKIFDKGLYANNIMQARGELSYYSQTYNKKVFEAVNDSVTINGSLAVDGDVTFYGNINTASDVRANFQSITAKSVKVNNKDVATADTVEAIQSDLNIAKQDIIEARGDIDNLQMNKQDKLTAGSGITIDADNVISATGGGVDLPIASSTTLGGIKVGENLTISEDGTLSAAGGGSGTTIDDSTTSSTSTWSSSKINSEINTVANEVVQVQGDVAGLSGDVTTLSGKVTAVEGKTTDLESALANKQDKLTAGEGIAIDQSTNTISSTTPITYLTRAQYDALATKDANTMYVITDEEGGGGTPSDAPILDVPVNNCVLAMPTAPTFDGTNVKVYAGTKVAIPNGLNTDGTCKSNIVTLTSDATINQSTFNGDVTLMLKSDGTIDQTAYSYFEVDDISTITTLTAYCWYYDRKTNNHYLASSTGAKQGPYQRIKIGSYNQATDATTKYFNIISSAAINQYNNFVWVPDWSRVKVRSGGVNYTLAEPAMIFVYAESQQGLANTIVINGVSYDWQYIPNGHIGQSSCTWLLDAGDSYSYVSRNGICTIREIPLKGRKING